jgi:hypothetical protein
LDELAFSPGAFLVVHGLIGEAPLDFPVCHRSCLAPASFATLRRDSAASKTALRELSNRHGPRRMMALFATPLIYILQECRAEEDRKSLGFFFHGGNDR